jgi:hypothetical protein
MSDGVVHVIEDLGTDGYTCAGLWSARWHQGLFQITRGPEGVSASDAIAWGRERADVVLVSPCDSETQYSAGRNSPPGHPTWPDGHELPPRPSLDTPASGSGGDSRILWGVNAGTMSATLDLVGLAARYDASLRADRDIEDVLRSPHVPAPGRLDCEFTVLASSAEEARAIALDASERALHTAAIGLARTRDEPEPVLPTSTLVHSYVNEPVPIDPTG